MLDTLQRALDCSELEACSIHQWQPTLRRVTIRTVLLRLPQPVVAYLTADGPLFLPDDSDAEDEAGDGATGGADEAESTETPPAEHAIESDDAASRSSPELRTLCADIDAAIQRCAYRVEAHTM